MAVKWHVGVIGGSGLYDLPDLADVQEIPISSPFGEPSGPVLLGTIGDVKFSFLSRHGEGHRISPSEINYRANVDVLKRSGVTDLISLSAVGSLSEDIAPGQFVTVDQIIDRTVGRERSFFGHGLVAHVGMADPTCARLSDLAANAIRAAGGPVHRGGCYVAIEGPQFSSRAESELYRSWGAKVIGMTAMPEARLAREAELPYALVGMVTDYDCWREGEEDVTVAEILSTMRANVGIARDSLLRLAKALPEERTAAPADTALDNAIVTDRAHWDRTMMLRLDTVAGRIMRSVE